MKNNPTKENILSSARKLFSTNGFDGTSVDDLAKEAGITKSLLYYYYKSKTAVFEDLMKLSLEKTILKLHNLINDNPPSNKHQLMLISLSAIESEKDVLRIALSEVLKTESKTEHIFDLVGAILDEYRSLFRFSDRERLLYCFFIVKVVVFSALKEKFADMFNMDINYVEKAFIDNIEPVFDEIYHQ